MNLLYIFRTTVWTCDTIFLFSSHLPLRYQNFVTPIISYISIIFKMIEKSLARKLINYKLFSKVSIAFGSIVESQFQLLSVATLQAKMKNRES